MLHTVDICQKFSTYIETFGDLLVSEILKLEVDNGSLTLAFQFPKLSLENTDTLLAKMTERKKRFGSVQDNLKVEYSIEDNSSGFTYILLNSSMPGLLKIGETTRQTEQRIKELNSATGVPTPFVMAYELKVQDCHFAERQIHQELDRYRFASNREFFDAPIDVAINCIKQFRD